MIWEYQDTCDEYERDALGGDGWEAYAATVQKRHDRDGIGRIVNSEDVLWFHMRRVSAPPPVSP